MSCHTSRVKVAISLPAALFERADAVADRLNINRSQLYVRALERFLEAEGDDPVTAKLDELAATFSGSAGAEAGRRLIDEGAWEW